MLDSVNLIFTHFIYQPFFNLLVLIYYVLYHFNPQIDMGMAVIVFTIVFRIIILPLSLSTNQTEDEKRDMANRLKIIEKKYKNDPIKQTSESKKVFHGNKRVIITEFFDIGIQVIIALMLIRIFSTGLEGADFHLLYKNIPVPDHPFNLVFLGKYDLTKPNVFLNLINSLVIFSAEALNIIKSIHPITREDKMALFVFPVVAFIYLAFMPAGKKLFIITTILFSNVLMIVEIGSIWYHKLTEKLSVAFYSKIKKV